MPAIVDEATTISLHLVPGSIFIMSLSIGEGSPTTSTTFLDIAQVQNISSINSSAQGAPTADTPAGGVIVDYRTYAAIFLQAAMVDGSAPVPLNYAWVNTQDTPGALASVRIALNGGDLQISPLYDRRALLDNLEHEPLYQDLTRILAIGAVITLLLALLGNLLTSWLSARGRQINFAVMRALGISPRQVAAVLAWEQGVIYTVAVLLGLGFGVLLSLLVVPALVFTGVPSSGVGSDVTNQAFYIAQSVPPIQVIFSPWLSLVLAGLVAICIIALALMVRVVTRPALG